MPFSKYSPFSVFSNRSFFKSRMNPAKQQNISLLSIVNAYYVYISHLLFCLFVDLFLLLVVFQRLIISLLMPPSNRFNPFRFHKILYNELLFLSNKKSLLRLKTKYCAVSKVCSYNVKSSNIAARTKTFYHVFTKHNIKKELK